MPLIVEDILRCAASTRPQGLAATLGDDALTFGQLADLAERCAVVFDQEGIGRNSVVAWWSEIDLAGIVVYFAATRLGACFVPLDPSSPVDDIRDALDYVGADLLVVDGAHEVAAVGLARDGRCRWVRFEHGAPGDDADHDLARLIQGVSGPCLSPSAEEDDIATIFLTSGSTGRPKGVMVAQRATWLRTHAGAAAHTTTGGGGSAVMFPLFHMAGWNFAGMAWSAHQAAHFVRRADADQLLDAVRRWSATSLYCIPAVWRRILDSEDQEPCPSLEWALTGTSRVELDLLAAIAERFPGSSTTVSYGATETARSIALRHDELLDHPHSIGLPIPGVRTRLADDGELLVATDRAMTGYLDMPEETAAVLVDGWYHTGDLAEVDADGYLYVVGRKREVIRTGGETVAPVEVEAAIGRLRGVRELAVVGLPDETWGEVVCVAVVPERGAGPPTVDAVRDQLDGRVEPYKVPRRVAVVDEIPRTAATGQVQRAVLVRRLTSELGDTADGA